MSLLKYFQGIHNIDPGKIYVENVRSILNVSTSAARTICEMAVRDNVFTKKIGVVCPNDNRIIAQYNSLSEIPEFTTCEICESEDRDQFTFQTNQLEKIEFYKLNK